MATLEQIGSALKKAHAAGDVAAARKLAAAYKAEVVRGGSNMAGPSAPPPPSAGPMDFLSQGLSGFNEGLANTLGAPVELTTDLMNLGSAGLDKLTGWNTPPIEHPFGGTETFRQMLSPTIGKESEDPSLKFTRRIGQEVGAWALPGMGTIGKAAKPAKLAAKELMGAMGSGTGAAIAQAAAPGNPLAEFAGQVIGGLTPGGAARTLSRPRKPTMSVDALRDAKNAAYSEADNLGAAYSPQAYDRLMSNMVNAATKDHISPDRHKAAYSMLVDLIARRGKPFSLTELDQLRQEVRRDLITPSYGNPTNAADAHFGEVILDQIDDFIASAKPGDMAGGSASDAANAIIKARSLNTRYRKAETLADALYKAKLQAAASGSGGNLNNAIRQQIKSILTNPKKVKSFTKEERAAMEGLVKQGNVENLLRWVGKFAPGGNGLIGMLEIAGTIHNPALAALPVAGMVSKGIADRGTLNKVLQLQDRVATGSPAKLRRPPALPSTALMIGQGANQLVPEPLRITVRGGR